MPVWRAWGRNPRKGRDQILPSGNLGENHSFLRLTSLLPLRFKQHGSPDLLLAPRPPLVRIIDPDPYSDPSNPPPPDPDAAFCGVKWSNETADATGQS